MPRRSLRLSFPTLGFWASAANAPQTVTARPGARFGPTGIRQGSRRMSASWGWSVYTGAEILICFVTYFIYRSLREFLP